VRKEAVISIDQRSHTRLGASGVATLVERLQAIVAVTLSGTFSLCPLRSALGPALLYHRDGACAIITEEAWRVQRKKKARQTLRLCG